MAKSLVRVHTHTHTQCNLVNRIIMAEVISLNYGIFETDELNI